MKTKILILKNDEVYKYDELSNSILRMKGRLDLPNRLWFVLFEKEWLGFGGYRKIDNERIYFGPTMIREKYRGLGLQRKLIRARLRAAKKEGYKEAISSIYSYNYTSGNNLLSEGFRLCKIPAYYDTEPDEVWFKKVLNV
jgi:L-amino acid N-acyltransferase YncA